MQIPVSYGSMLHIPPTNCLLLTAKQEPYKKAYLLMKNIEEFSGKKFRRKGQQAENDKTEKVTGLGRRTREEIAKWNQMTALRFETKGRHQTSPASLRGWPDLMNGKHDHTTAVCVSLRSSGGLRVVQLPAGSWYGLPFGNMVFVCVVSCGSTSFPWLVFFFGALL